MRTDSETIYGSTYKPNGPRGNGQRDNGHGIGASPLLAGAAGFGLGLLAAAGRKAVVQAPTAMAGDWFEGLKAEHAAARKILEKLEQTTDAEPAKRAPLVLALQHAIGKHNVQEEYVIYCVLKETGDAEAAIELNADHAELKQALFDLEQLGKDQSPSFIAKVYEIRAAFEEHVREEEDVVFPRMHAALSPERTKALTSRMLREGFKVA